MPTTNPSTLHPNPSAAALPYNPALSLWLSVDPLSDKYPGVSPYAYCADNPVRLVDKDGRDIWELDECGKIVNHIEDNKIDQFHIVDSKGNCIAESDAYRVGTFHIMANEHGKTLFNVNGETDDVLCSAFEFFADNLDIEWESIMTLSGKMFLGTRQCADHTDIFRDVESLNEVITVHSHNHPSGNTLPSGIQDQTKDMRFATKHLETRGYIYTRENGYDEYDQYGPLRTRLEGITIR